MVSGYSGLVVEIGLIMGVVRGAGRPRPWNFIHDISDVFYSRGRLIGAIFRSWFFHCPPSPLKFFCRRPWFQPL